MRETFKLTAATLATFTLLMLLWQGSVWYFEIPEYVLPAPRRIGEALIHAWVGGAFWEHAWFTVKGALIGFVIGSIAAVICGVLVAEVRPAALALYPLVIGIQSMPTVAIAPLIIVYFGIGLASKVVTVSLLCFFPVFVNTVHGLRSADPRLIDLYRAASATRLRTLVDVKFPSAVDHIMASLQIAMVLSFVGCVVSEFVASTAGLGHIIRTFANDLNVAVMFAAIVSLGVIGASAGSLITLLHRRVVFWR